MRHEPSRLVVIVRAVTRVLALGDAAVPARQLGRWKGAPQQHAERRALGDDEHVVPPPARRAEHAEEQLALQWRRKDKDLGVAESVQHTRARSFSGEGAWDGQTEDVAATDGWTDLDGGEFERRVVVAQRHLGEAVRDEERVCATTERAAETFSSQPKAGRGLWHGRRFDSRVVERVAYTAP